MTLLGSAIKDPDIIQEGTMRARIIGAGLLAIALLSACTTSSADPTPTPSPCPVQSDSVETQEPDATTAGACSGGTGSGGQSGSGSGGGNAPGGPGGGGSTGPGGGLGGGGLGGGVGGTGAAITRTRSETVEVSGDGVQSVTHQSYTAVVHLTMTGGEGTWTFTGSADITAAYRSDYSAQMADILGAPCDVHYTDDASAAGTVQIDGGLEASDGFYQFFVNIPGIDTGTNNTLRNDSDCGGPNISDSAPWSAAPTSASGSGEYTGTIISGSSSSPLTGGEDAVAWNFTIPN